jgi:predicted  nucleic acid-binding Zn-ribbon protein
MQEVYRALLELQALDEEIILAKERVMAFGPQLEAIEAPLQALDRDAGALRSKLVDMRKELRRLEQNADSKRDKLRQYEERASRVRNAREDAAVKTELDLVRRATDADEQEALQTMEQITRSELKLDEMDRNLEKMRSELTPQREELARATAEAEQKVSLLDEQRRNHLVRIDSSAIKLYDRVRASRNRKALAALTADGACGRCFNVLPVQQQQEVRNATTLMRCEGCGVILYVEE